MKVLLVLLVLVLTPALAFGADIYDDRKGDGSVGVCGSGEDAISINARAVCVENLSSSTDTVYFRCDAAPVIGTGATLRAGLTPGEKTCMDGSLVHHKCMVIRLCTNGTGAATYTVRWVTASTLP